MYLGRTTGNLEYEKKIFNYRQARARRVIENSYGIYAGVWRIFRTEINASPETVERIVLAAACLHNFRISEQEDSEDDIELLYLIGQPDTPGQTVFHSGIDSIEPADFLDEEDFTASFIRDELAEYFVSEGSVYWQDQMIN